jgi:sugar O-acyltransferase (sialic acid O-acetyltransferase NeuD family)
MKPLLFYGASGFGDEIVQLFRDINAIHHQWDLKGFIDDDPSNQGKIRNGLSVLGDRVWLDGVDLRELSIVCCIGNPQIRGKIVSLLAERNANFAKGVHPSVIQSRSVEIEAGSMVMANNSFTTNINVGKHVIINPACTVGHGTVIEDFVTVNPGVNVSGNVWIQKMCYLGTNSAILEKLTIGQGSIIGAGAVVTEDIPPRVTAVGVPARIIKKHSENE